MDKKIIDYIKEVASQDMYYDNPDFNPCDHAGGNFDDAFQLGMSDGEIMFARTLLEKFNLDS